MNRKSLLVAAAATLAIILGLSAAPQASAAQPTPANNIVDLAIAVNRSGPYAGLFDTLIAAVVAADPAVLKRLTSKGQSTVLAPTDDGFAALGLTPENIGDLPQSALTDNLGRPANIIVTDVPASNGIIHAIDAVVLPFAP